MAIFTWPDRFTSFFTAQSHKKKTDSNRTEWLKPTKAKGKRLGAYKRKAVWQILLAPPSRDLVYYFNIYLHFEHFA